MLESEIRIGLAPSETATEVESEYQNCLDDVAAENEWLSSHPPEFERFSVQFEGSEIDQEEPIVQSLEQALRHHDIEPTLTGFTGGTDARHYIEEGIPAVVFGPGSTNQAHQPDEFIDWEDIVEGSSIIAKTVVAYLNASQSGEDRL